jgi:hypothetical protein
MQSKIATFVNPETMQEQFDGIGLGLDQMPVEPDKPSILPIIEQLAQAVAMLAQASAAPRQIQVARDQNGFITTGVSSPVLQ